LVLNGTIYFSRITVVRSAFVSQWRILIAASPRSDRRTRSRENFYLDLAGGSSGRAAGAVFHNAHLAYKLPRANRAKKDGFAIEFPEYANGTAEEAKNTVRRVSLFEEDFPFSEVRASHCGPLISINNQWRNSTRAN
jgi:hypothetical protein